MSEAMTLKERAVEAARDLISSERIHALESEVAAAMLDFLADNVSATHEIRFQAEAAARELRGK